MPETLGRAGKLVAALMALACAAAAQDLAPEVLLLSRIKRHLAAELERIPNYTCLETVSRFRREPKPGRRTPPSFAALDTVRLEIVYSNRREWYGSPGSRNLSTDDPASFIGAGMIGTGAFAIMLNNILGPAMMTYRGEELIGGRQAVRYDFRLPRLLKPLSISMPGGSGTAGEEGSVWADPQSLDLIRVSSRATEIPPYLPLTESTMDVTYARTRIGDSNVLIAQQADSRLVEPGGAESYNRLEFTHCHAYSAQSEIRFDVEPAQPAPVSEAAAPTGPRIADAPAVPPFLPVAVQLVTPVSDRDSVGALIEGRVSENVLRKGKVVVPRGAAVSGRIRRLERFPGRDAFIVGLEFTEVQTPAGSLPFYADLLRIEKNPLVQAALTDRILIAGHAGLDNVTEAITLPELPGVASFFVTGAAFTLPAGFQTFWRTRGPIH